MKSRIPNTFNMPVYAKEVITITSVAQLLTCYRNAVEQDLPILVLGQGSNTLFTEDFDGIVILNRISGMIIEQNDEYWLIKVGAGEIWHQLVKQTIEQHIPGLENLALIPGCVGSAPIQNIGAYGIEFEKVADYVELLELQTGQIITVTDGQYGYRDSIFKSRYLKGYVIINVGIKLSKQWLPVLSYGELKRFDITTVTPKMIYDKVCEIRSAKLPDPNVFGNGGSFFKNPVITAVQAENLLKRYPDMPVYPQANGQVKLAAGWLIDRCGLKGYQIGGAAVHEQQALVLINKHQASTHDVIALARYVKQTVQQKFAIDLEAEIRFIGRQEEIDANLLLS